uniref:Uncharacterized protein n=1 Tax=Rhizophora mucronata TaxID=61149 RepID=A0A2P2QQV2_RHIMU
MGMIWTNLPDIKLLFLTYYHSYMVLRACTDKETWVTKN